MPRDSTPRILAMPSVKFAAGNEGARRREHAYKPGARIGRAAHDLQRFRLPVSTVQQPQLVGIGMLLGGDHARDDEAASAAALSSRLSTSSPMLVSVSRDASAASASVVEMILQPGERELHRLKPSVQRRDVERSEAVMLQPAQIGVEERPNVGDAVFQHRHAVEAEAEGEALIARWDRCRTFSSTRGWTMPEPPISSQSLPSPNLICAARAVALHVDFHRRLGEGK